MTKKTTTLLFDIGLIIKGIDSLLEIVGGILLFTPAKLGGVLEQAAQHSRNDVVARLLDRAAWGVLGATALTATYLVIHGVGKVFFIVAAMKGIRWGYIGLLAILLLFVVIELIHYFQVHRIGILVFSGFDLLLVILIANEYRIRFMGKQDKKG